MLLTLMALISVLVLNSLGIAGSTPGLSPDPTPRSHAADNPFECEASDQRLESEVILRPERLAVGFERRSSSSYAIELSWEDASEGEDCYVVRRTEAGRGQYFHLPPDTAAFRDPRARTSETRVRYDVRAIGYRVSRSAAVTVAVRNPAGPSAACVAGTVTDTLPAPTRGSGSSTPSGFRLSWTDNATSEDCYVVRRDISEGNRPQRVHVDVLNANTTSFVYHDPKRYGGSAVLMGHEVYVSDLRGGRSESLPIYRTVPIP